MWTYSKATSVFLKLLSVTGAVLAGVFCSAHPLNDAVRPILRKRMFAIPGSSYEDVVPFDQLHSRYLDRDPQRSAALKGDILEHYPEIHFYHEHPILYDLDHLGVSRGALEKAYDTFGRVHVTDTEAKNLITIGPPLEASSINYQDSQPKYVDEGLARFLEQIRFVKTNFGRDAAIVAYGWKLNPRKIDWKGAIKYAYWGGSESMGSRSDYAAIRKKLDRKRFVEIESREGNSHLILELLRDGTIHRSVTGDLANEARRLHL